MKLSLAIALLLLSIMNGFDPGHLQQPIHFQPEQIPSFITFEQFGATGSGKDETKAILAAFAAASQKKLPVRLLNKKTYIFSPSNTVDITGIPAIEGEGTLDLSNVGAAAGNKSLTAVFQVTGRIKKIGNGLTEIRAGASSVAIEKQLELKAGDVLFVTSSEPLPNRRRPYYSKGQRITVKKYDPVSGRLDISGKFYYDFGSACLWLNHYIPCLNVSKDIQFVTAPMNLVTAIRLYYACANISGSFKNFALTAVMFKSSSGVVEDAQIDLPVSMNNGYSHGIEVIDHSLVTIKNCKMQGGRHVVSGGGGGLWRKEECGGTGAAGFPAELTVDGGEYRGSNGVPGIGADIGTLDSHGVVERITIKNCVVYGGINLGANHINVHNVTIYTDGKRAFTIGSDVQPGSTWGNITISNVRIITSEKNENAIISSKADVTDVKMEKVTVSGLKNNVQFMDLRYNAPKKISLKSVTLNRHPGRSPVITAPRSTHLTLANCNFSEADILRLKY